MDGRHRSGEKLFMLMVNGIAIPFLRIIYTSTFFLHFRKSLTLISDFSTKMLFNDTDISDLI